MHPLLLFTLLFIPGIRSSHQITQDFINLRNNGGERNFISNTDIAPIEEPSTDDATNLVLPDQYDKRQLKPYEGHISKKFDKYINKDPIGLKKHHEFLSSKQINVHKHGISSKEQYESDRYETTPTYHGSKPKYSKKNIKYHEEKNLRHKIHEKNKFDESKRYKKSKELKEEKQLEYDTKGKFIDKEKNFNKNKNKETSTKGKGGHNEELSFKKDYIKRKKATEEFFKKHFKFDKERKRMERAKRQTDSSESEDEDYNGDDEEDSDENASLGSAEKQMFTHLLEGTMAKDEYHPYVDAIEVKLKEKSGEEHDLVPVVEDEITKKMAYVSCGRGGGPGCGKGHQVIEDQHEYSVHAGVGGSKKQEADSDSDTIDLGAWLKAFEDEIINTGVDVKYNHH